VLVSYEKLINLMNSKGDSFNSLREKGVITDYAGRRLNNNEYLDVKYLARLCRYYDVPIEDIVEVISKSD